MAGEVQRIYGYAFLRLASRTHVLQLLTKNELRVLLPYCIASVVKYQRQH
jgi:hypothetical protein